MALADVPSGMRKPTAAWPDASVVTLVALNVRLVPVSVTVAPGTGRPLLDVTVTVAV